MALDAPEFMESAARLILASIFSAAIGWEREQKGRSAGLRTHILVALGATGFTLVALEISGAAVAAGISPPYDPGRIISTIVGGVGFLGAGAILHSRHRVHGLTTAAGVWAVAAIGVACGCGLYSLAILMTALGLVTLVVIKRLEKKWFDDDDAEMAHQNDSAEPGTAVSSDRD